MEPRYSNIYPSTTIIFQTKWELSRDGPRIWNWKGLKYKPKIKFMKIQTKIYLVLTIPSN